MESNKKKRDDGQQSSKQCASIAPLTIPSCHGPRTVLLHRTENGFGFTLRHFIVYPPDTIQVENNTASSNKENDENALSSSSLEPMDTIFVKHIREGGPAHRAGLATGDRIVSVNGETISGKTYSEVVQLIQKSRNSLQLLVVPKEDDILQLYFPGTAYHGESSSLTRDPSSKYKKTSSDLKNFHSSFPSTNFSSSSSSSLSSLNNPHFDDSNRAMPVISSSLTHENLEVQREEPVERFKSSDYSLSTQSNCSLTSKTLSKDFSTNSLTRESTSDTHQTYPFKCESYMPTSLMHQQSSNIYFSNHPSSFSKTDIKHEDSYVTTDKQNQHSNTHFLWENASQSLPSNSHQNSGYPKNIYLKSSHFSEATTKSNCNGEKFFQDLGKCQVDNKDFSNECRTSSNQLWYVDNDRLAERLKQSLERKEKFLLKTSDHDDSASDCSLNLPQPSMFIMNRDKSKDFGQQSKINLNSWPQKLSGFRPLPVNNMAGNVNLSHDNQENKGEVLKMQLREKSASINHEVKPVKNQIISGIGSVKFHTCSNGLISEKTVNNANENSCSTNIMNASESSNNHVSLTNCFKPYFTSTSSQHKAITPKRASSFLRKASSLDSDVPKPSALRPVENQQVLQFQLVSQRTKQFESGSVEDEAKNRTNLYRNELCRLTSKCQTPSVLVRTAQFESLSSSQDTCSSEEVGPHTTHLKPKREKQDFKWQRSYSDSVSCGLSSATAVAEISASSVADDGGKCKNSLYVPSMAVSSRKTPSNSNGRDLQMHDLAGIENDNVSKFSFDSASADEEDFPRKKAVRQNSYLQAVQSPYKGISSLAITVSATTSTTNSITTTATKTTSTSLMGPYFALAGIVSERKAFYEDDPLTAGVTNAKPRNNKLLDGNLDKGQISDKNETPCNRAQNIQKLKAFFGEKTPQILEATERHSSSSSEILKEGFLHCKILLIDGKRSTDRSWKQFWGCLRGTALFLYRDKISQQLLSPEEQALVLKPVSADVAYNYTKKKNVFQLIASNGTEYLFQAEDNEEMQDWIYYIQNHCISDNMNVENQFMTSRATETLSRLSPQPIQKRIKKLTSFRNRSPTNQSPVVKNRKTIHGEDIFPKAKTWKGKMVKTIRKIHGTSSNSPDVPEGVTINVPLEDCPPSSINEFLPLFVELCTSIVEARGLEMVGIYRVPGNTAAVTALLDAVNKGFDNLNLQDPRWNDVNVISSMLKAFFRKLPDPLITSELYPFFIAANKITDNSQKLYTFKKLLHELPDHHYETLKFLIKHLRKIVAHSIINKMEARNLAIVFGPTLVRAADDNMATMVTDMSHQCCIVETLINEAEWFFDDENDYNWEYYNKNDMLQDKNSYDNLILNNAKSTLDASNSEAVNAKEIIASIIAAANEVSKNKTKKFSVCSAPAIGDHMNYDDHDGNQKMDYGNNQMQSFYSTIKPRPSDLEMRNNEMGNHIFHSGKRTASADSLSTFQDSLRRLKESNYDMNHERYLNTRTSNHDAMTTTSNNIFDDGILRSYAGLSASTQERIRRFEMETRALLQRDLNRQQRENEQRQAERERIELEWQKAKQELEQDDPLDVLADNLSATTSKTSDSISNVSKSSNDLTDSKPFHRFRVNPVKLPGSSIISSVRPSSTKQALANRKTHLHYESSEDLKGKNFIYFNGKEDSLRLNSDTRHALDLLASSGNSSNQSDANIQFGSLDSVHGLSERSMSSLTSSEESDLMSSITATLNHRLSKLKDSNTILSSGNRTLKFNPYKSCSEPSASDVPLPPPNDQYCPYRDPSLHRNQDTLASFEGTVASRTKAFNEQLNQINKNIQENISSPSKKYVNKYPNQQSTVDTISSNFAKQIHTPLGCAEKGALEESSDGTKLNTTNDTTEKPVTNQHNSDEESPKVQVHRNEHTLITATISTTKQTVTSSSTTAIITATIVTTPSKKKTYDAKADSTCVQKNSDLKKSQKEMTNISEKNIKTNKALTSSKVMQESLVVKLPDEAVSSSFPLQKNRSKQNTLKRRHTVGGTKDFDKFQFLLSKNLPTKDSQLSAWERLQPELSGNDLSSPPRTMNNWLERERLRMSFPNLTPVKIPIEF